MQIDATRHGYIIDHFHALIAKHKDDPSMWTATDAEIADAVDKPRRTVGRARAELVTGGILKVHGRRNRSQTWRLVSDGEYFQDHEEEISNSVKEAVERECAAEGIELAPQKRDVTEEQQKEATAIVAEIVRRSMTDFYARTYFYHTLNLTKEPMGSKGEQEPNILVQLTLRGSDITDFLDYIEADKGLGSKVRPSQRMELQRIRTHMAKSAKH